MQALMYNCNVERLTFNNGPIGQAALSIAKLLTCSKIIKLNLFGSIDNEGFVAIVKGLSVYNCVEDLRLSLSIDNVNLIDIPSLFEFLKSNTTLKRLHLNDFELDDDLLIKLLDALDNNQNIEYIDILEIENNITEIGHNRLYKFVLQHPKLKELFIEDTEYENKEVLKYMKHNVSDIWDPDYNNINNEIRSISLLDICSNITYNTVSYETIQWYYDL
jgi:hypothetical protein